MKEIEYNRVGDFKFPSLKGERSLPNLSRFGRKYLIINIKRKTSRSLSCPTSKR